MQRYISQYNTKVNELQETKQKYNQLVDEYNKIMSKISEETDNMYQTRYSGGNTQ